MSRSGELLRLQQADDAVAAWERQAAELESALAGDPELDRLRASADEQRGGLLGARRDLAAAELELATVRDRVALLTRQLYGGSIRDPHELLTLQRELEGTQERVGALEDAVLNRMEDVETVDAGVEATERLVTDLEERRRSGAPADRARLDELRSTLIDARAEVAATRGALNGADRELYDRLARRVPPAVVLLTNDACGGCRMPLGIQEARDVRSADRLVQCATCDRILAS